MLTKNIACTITYCALQYDKLSNKRLDPGTLGNSLEIQVTKANIQAPPNRSPKCSVIVGAASLHVGCEYPFWAIKVHMQNNPTEHKYTVSTIKNLYKQKGFFRGFYPGAIPFFALTLCKQSYRLPALSFLPDYFETRMPEKWESYHRVPTIVAATTLSLFEAAIFGPIERVVCYRIIHAELPSINIRFLYTGTGIALSKGLFAWNLFTSLENFAHTKAQRLLKKETLDALSTFGVGMFVGSSMTIINQPLSALQTFAQTRPTEDKRPLLTAFGEHLKKHSARALFAGTSPALIQGVIRSSITVFALEKLRDRKPKIG